MEEHTNPSAEFKKELDKQFYERLYPVSENHIIELSESDHGIFSVVRGLNKESFGAQEVGTTETNNFEYRLIYITTSKNGDLVGDSLHLQPYLKYRNELVIYFAAYLCKKFSMKKNYEVFNTLQNLQTTLFERLGYWTYNDEFPGTQKGDSFTMAIESTTLPLYVPFANKKRERRNSAMNYVYIIHNPQNGYYKIGRSINPDSRERTLQAQEPQNYIKAKWKAPAEVETQLHRRFKEKRLRGEWFSLSETDLEEIMAFMYEFEDSE